MWKDRSECLSVFKDVRDTGDTGSKKNFSFITVSPGETTLPPPSTPSSEPWRRKLLCWKQKHGYSQMFPGFAVWFVPDDGCVEIQWHGTRSGIYLCKWDSGLDVMDVFLSRSVWRRIWFLSQQNTMSCLSLMLLLHVSLSPGILTQHSSAVLCCSRALIPNWNMVSFREGGDTG